MSFRRKEVKLPRILITQDLSAPKLKQRKIIQQQDTQKVPNQLKIPEEHNEKSSNDKIEQELRLKNRKRESQFKSYLRSTQSKLTLQFYEYFTFFCRCIKQMRSKRNQINFGIRKLEKQIDILYIIKKLTEIEKLKMLLLTQSQLKLFDYLPKPCIPTSEDDDELQHQFEQLQQGNSAGQYMAFWPILQGEKSLYQRIIEAYEAYEEIRQKQKKDEIDEKLIKFLDPNMKNLFAFRFASSRINEIDEQGPQSCFEENLISEENSRMRSMSEVSKIPEKDQEN